VKKEPLVPFFAHLGSREPSSYPSPLLTPKNPRFGHLDRSLVKTERFSMCLNLGGNLGLGVGHLDAQLLGAGDDVDALAGRDVVGNPIGHVC
jgi:hypothetical protein